MAPLQQVALEGQSIEAVKEVLSHLQEEELALWPAFPYGRLQEVVQPRGELVPHLQLRRV